MRMGCDRTLLGPSGQGKPAQRVADYKKYCGQAGAAAPDGLRAVRFTGAALLCSGPVGQRRVPSGIRDAYPGLHDLTVMGHEGRQVPRAATFPSLPGLGEF